MTHPDSSDETTPQSDQTLASESAAPTDDSVTGDDASILEQDASEGAEASSALPPELPPSAPEPEDQPAKSAADSASDEQADGQPAKDWYILKVAFNREESIADALRKRIKMEGMEEFVGDVVVPTEDVATFNRDGKRRISKRKLLPGYVMAHMIINDDTWFLVRETAGISDFTGSAGKPMPMEPEDIERFINRPQEVDEEDAPIKTAIPFKVGDRVRVKEGNFENQEGEVDVVDEASGRISVIINIFGRSVPMELDHWQVEPL